MKKYLSILCAAATVAALLISCDKDGDKTGGNTLDADDPGTVKTENLVAYFPLESETNAVVAEGVTYSKKAGAAGFVDGLRGKCYSNTSGECRNISYLDFALAENNPFKSMTSFTISAWVKMPVPDADAPSLLNIDAGDGYMGSLNIMFEKWGCNADSLYVKAYLFDSADEWKGQDLGLDRAAFTTDKWFNLVYSYNEADSKITLYSNGVFVADSGRWGGPADENGENQPPLGEITLDPAMAHLYIGAWATNLDGTADENGRSSYAGLVDEIRIWNVALTPEEVEELYTKEVIKADGLE